MPWNQLLTRCVGDFVAALCGFAETMHLYVAWFSASGLLLLPRSARVPAEISSVDAHRCRLKINVGDPTNRRRKSLKYTPPRRGRKKNETGGRGRGKEAGPALNPLKGSSAFLPSDAGVCGTPRTKLNSLKTNGLHLPQRVKNPTLRVKFPSPPQTPIGCIIYLRNP